MHFGIDKPFMARATTCAAFPYYFVVKKLYNRPSARLAGLMPLTAAFFLFIFYFDNFIYTQEAASRADVCFIISFLNMAPPPLSNKMVLIPKEIYQTSGRQKQIPFHFWSQDGSHDWSRLKLQNCTRSLCFVFEDWQMAAFCFGLAWQSYRRNVKVWQWGRRKMPFVCFRNEATGVIL